MKYFLQWMFVESHAKWLLMILSFELWVALTLSPTILTDYFVAKSFVEMMSFIPAVHVFNSFSITPEATCFYIALGFCLLIPKSVAVYLFLKKYPYSQMSQYVITPYTKTKPHRSLRFGEELTEEEAKAFLTVERSMLNRIVWSLLSLVLAAMCIFINLIEVEVVSDFSLSARENQSLMQGGLLLWLNFSVFRLTVVALIMAVSFFIIKDYCRFIIEISNKLFKFVITINAKRKVKKTESSQLIIKQKDRIDDESGNKVIPKLTSQRQAIYIAQNITKIGNSSSRKMLGIIAVLLIYGVGFVFLSCLILKISVE